MPAIDIPQQEDESNDEVIKRLANTPGQFPAIGVASTAKPILTSQTGKAIPTGRVPGISGTINPDNGIYNQPPPGQPGVASLWAKADNIHNPVLRVLGKIGAGTARAIDTAGSIAAPAIATRVPGSTLNERFQENRQLGRETQESENTQREATTAEAQERTKEMPAKAELERAQAKKALTPTVDKPEDVAKLYADAVAEAVTAGRDPNTDPKVGQLADAVQRIQKQPAAGKPDSVEQQYQDAIESGDHGKAERLLRVMGDMAKAKQAPQRDPRQLAVGPDGKVIELKPGMTIPQGTQTVTGDLKGKEPTADEKRRADLAENLNENLAALEDIVSRKPELFGPFAGRLTGLKSAIGTDDPDIAALETIKHQIGMAQISAHGMKSAHGIDSAAESILNSFHNSPEAVKGAINAARNSVKTFSGDVAGKQAGAAAPGGKGGQQAAGGGAQHVPGGKAQGLQEGATGTGSDGKKYVVKGGVWAPQ